MLQRVPEQRRIRADSFRGIYPRGEPDGPFADEYHGKLQMARNCNKSVLRNAVRSSYAIRVGREL